ncbi:MAG TPA: IS1380 family transposase [Solirubrobacterales bacterium]|nr:IS1380 family transposase [Solirubrobacterales bacterium]
MRFAKTHSPSQEDTRKVKAQTTAQTVEVRADGEGLVSHAGSYLLVELADRLGLTAALAEAMAPTRERRSAHDPGVVIRDLAIAVADGGDHVSDLGVLRGQEALFGPVASETTAHRVVKSIGVDLLEAIRAARAVALARAWGAGARPEELILDIDASLLLAHSEKESAAGNYKGGFGFHPLLCYLAETGEPLAAVLRPGNAAAHTAADHFEVLQLALEQLPEADLGREILARTDIGGRTHAFTSDCRSAGIRFSVGYEVDERVRGAIMALPEAAWRSAIDGDGEVREGAQVAELTARVELSCWPEGTRLVVRRERPHPGAQLSVFDCESGYRHTAFITDQDDVDVAALELRHRRRARVEDAIRVGKETGMRKMPFAAYEHNQAWLEVSLLAQALLRWAARLCLDGELALAEPKRVRQRLLHVAGRIVRSGRRVALRLPRSWPWAEALVAAFARLRALPAAANP